MPVLGCAFDAELPVNVEIACESDADCPADAQGERFCELRLDPPACRYKENRDVELPELTETSLEPKQGMVGTILTATFTANEALMEDNLVVYLGSESLTFTRDDEADTGENQYVFTYTVSGNENEGVQNAKAAIQDRGGNAVEVDIGSVTLDFTTPVIGDVSLVHDRPLREGATGQVLFTVSESTTVEVSLGAWDETTDAGAVWSGTPMIADETVVAPSYGYTYTAMGDEPEDDAALLVRIVVTDAAGNASETTLDFNRFDFTPPTIASFTLEDDLFQPGDVVRAFVNFTEPIATLPALTGVYAEETQAGAVADIVLEGAQQNLDQQAFRRTVLVSDHEGRYDET